MLFFPIWIAANFCPYGGWTELQAEPTGFFYPAAQREGVWWWIDPHGHTFLSKGVNHVSYYADHAPALGYSPYHQTVAAAYGSEARWAEAAVQRLRRWGFNTIGAWSSPSTYDRGMAYSIILNVAARTGADWQSGRVVDVFSAAFAQTADRVAAEACAPRREDPLLLGYFTDNELRWGPDWRSPRGLLAEYWNFPKDAAGHKAAREYLREHYGSVDRLNAEWRTQYASWEEVFQKESLEAVALGIAQAHRARADRGSLRWLPEAQRVHRLQEQFSTVAKLNAAWGTDWTGFSEAAALSQTPGEAALERLEHGFLQQVAQTYFRTVAEAIHRYDPNHAILGCRFAGYAPRPVLAAIGDWVDVISFNNYDFLPPESTLQEIYRLTGKPILLTEFSFKAMDSGLPNTKGAGRPVETQQDRANHFERYVTALMRLPFVIGYHWFEYVDEPAEGRFDGENSNYGLVDVNDRPWKVLTERMRLVNGRIEEVHRRAESTADREAP